MLTITIERDRSKLPRQKFRAKIRNGPISFAGSLYGSVARAKLDVENLLERPLHWSDNTDSRDDLCATAILHLD